MAQNPASCDQPQFACSGIAGLDEILRGGFPAGHVYLIEGMPGAGKTTLGMQFLLEGVRCGEPVLYITLSETKQDLEKAAQSHGWSLDGIELVHPGEGCAGLEIGRTCCSDLELDCQDFR